MGIDIVGRSELMLHLEGRREGLFQAGIPWSDVWWDDGYADSWVNLNGSIGISQDEGCSSRRFDDGEGVGSFSAKCTGGRWSVGILWVPLDCRLSWEVRN